MRLVGTAKDEETKRAPVLDLIHVLGNVHDVSDSRIRDALKETLGIQIRLKDWMSN